MSISMSVDSAAQPGVVIFSSHLDDAILSCGGTIYALTTRGVAVKVVTLFTKSPTRKLSPFAHWMHKVWGLSDDAMCKRRDEDCKAVSSLGAKFDHLPFLDCIYRWDPSTGLYRYLTHQDIFSGELSSEAFLVGEIARMLVDHFPNLERNLIIVPLGIGNHIDHLVTRNAIEKYIGSFEGNRILYYEDFPYVIKFSTFVEGYPFLSRESKYCHGASLTKESLQAKVKAVLFYKSQIQQLKEGFGIQVEQIREYASSITSPKQRLPYAERFWFSEKGSFKILSDLLDQDECALE